MPPATRPQARRIRGSPSIEQTSRVEALLSATSLRGPKSAVAQSQPFSSYHLAVRREPSGNDTEGVHLKSSRVFVLSHTQSRLSIFTFSRVSITVLPRTLPYAST